MHTLLGMPVTIRSKGHKGIRIERGVVVERVVSGPVLEEVLFDESGDRTVPESGAYKGKAVIVAPIRTRGGDAVAAIGIVDLVAAMDILDTFKEYPGVMEWGRGSQEQDEVIVSRSFKDLGPHGLSYYDGNNGYCSGTCDDHQKVSCLCIYHHCVAQEHT